MKDDPGDPVLTPDLLLHGYSIGIFPMAEHRDDPEIFWVDPRRRGVLPLDDFQISRSLRRRMRKPDVSVTLDQEFDRVLAGCADRSETWINDEIANLYKALFRQNRAHSLEVWYGSDLAGGVYGVTMGAAFFGESMFSHARDASKIALACLTTHLRDCGFTLFDTQFVTPHLLTLGAVEVSRREYHHRLAAAIRRRAQFPDGPVPPPLQVVQRITQTS